MTEETTEQFLARRERELMNRVAALRGQLNPLEAELGDVQRMRALMAEKTDKNLDAAKRAMMAGMPERTTNADIYTSSINPLKDLVNPYAGKTIKELVVQSLLDAFPKGATTMEMRDFFRSGYGRTVDPSSLRTQLHRMKAAGIVIQDTSNDNWNFCIGKRALYDTYRQVPPPDGITELQDDPDRIIDRIDSGGLEDSEFLKTAEKLAWTKQDDEAWRQYEENERAGIPQDDRETFAAKRAEERLRKG
jgi:hypothetical protein